MKKTILSALLMLSALASMAQTTVDDRYFIRETSYDQSQAAFAPETRSENIEDYGIHMIGGVNYHLYSYNNEVYEAYIEPYSETENYTELVIPTSVTYQGEEFYVMLDNHCVCDNENLKTLIINGVYFYGQIGNCPNLETLELSEGIQRCYGINSCPKLEHVVIPSTCIEVSPPTDCESLKSITFKNTRTTALYVWGDADDWTKKRMPSLTDIYFLSDFPPICKLQYQTEVALSINPDVTIHVPQGAKAAYEHSLWHGWNIVDDLESGDRRVGLDYCGNGYSFNSGFTKGFYVFNGDDDVEFAIRLPAETMEAYKGCQVTAIEFFTGLKSISDEDFETVEYVFLTNSKEDYIVKQAVSTIRGQWMTIELNEPYTITGEDIFVGIGRHNAFAIDFARNETDKDGFWCRVMGEDRGGLEPGEWYHFEEDVLQVRALIEGESIPTDIAIRNVELIDKGDELEVKTRVFNRTPHLVKEVALRWDIDGKKSDVLPIETGLSTNQVGYFSFNIPKAIKGRNHTVAISVEAIDGESDAISSNSTYSVLYSKEATTNYPRKVVMEEATGTWCGWCPRGFVSNEAAYKAYPDNFILIAVHDDEMSDKKNGYKAFMDQVTEVPKIYINRQEWKSTYPATVIEEIEKYKDNAIAHITAEAEFTDANTVTVRTKTKFGFDDDGSTEYRIAYVLLEDNVGPYYQANYFSNPEAEDNPDDEYNWWRHQDEWVSMTFNDVARKIYGYNGVEGTLPQEVELEKEYETEYKLEMPETLQDARNLRVATLIIDGTTGEILNADCTAVQHPEISSIETLTQNPKLKTQYLFNLQGQRVGEDYRGIVIQGGRKYLKK